MALIKCKDCGADMSHTADKCEKCGKPNIKAEMYKAVGIAFIALIAFILYKLIF